MAIPCGSHLPHRGLAVFLGGAWIEGRTLKPRILRERLGGSRAIRHRQLELLRDEMLSKIPASTPSYAAPKRASLLQKVAGIRLASIPAWAISSAVL